MVDTSQMRPPAVILAVFPLAAALLAPVGPAQASLDAYLVVGYDASQRALSVTAGPGLAAMGDGELAITRSGTAIGLAIPEGAPLLVFDAAASASVTCRGAASGPQASLTCAPTAAIGTLAKVVVDMSAASVATTTAVDPDATDIALVFLGGSGQDYVQGGRLADRIEGGPGDDDLFGGRADDEVLGQEGSDQVDGERGSDVVDGGPGDDVVVGDGDVDTDEGQKGDPDWIYGGPGVDSVDALDGVQDHRVDCNNDPGLGKVSIDYIGGVVSPSSYLDVPFNCPLILVPTAPRDVEAFGDRFNISTTWSRPTFDGNATTLKIKLAVQNLSGGPKMFTAEFDAALGSITIGPYPSGVYLVTGYAISEAGQSRESNRSFVSVGDAAGPPADVTSAYDGKFDGQVTWTAAPEPASPGIEVAYQVALRVKDKRNTRWERWTTLPDSTTATRLDLSGSLRLCQGRVYQARVRTVLEPWGKVSAWVYSQERYAGDLAPPTITKVVAVGSRVPATGVTFTFEGPAWRLNGFAPLSPAYLKAGGRSFQGSVSSVPGKGSFTASFPIAGTSRDPNCELTVEYASAKGPTLTTTSAPFDCRPKVR